MGKFVCRNSECKYYEPSGEECLPGIELDENGKCTSFEKGFVYYFHIVWEALQNKNFIDAVEIQLNPDLKLGLYYVMEAYGLSYSVMEWGTCRMYLLRDEETEGALGYKQIIDRKMDGEKVLKLKAEFDQGILPGSDCSLSESAEEPVKKEFGWVSPTGVFTESPFGTHEESAHEICEKKGFLEEYRTWLKESGNEDDCLCRDFLAKVKGYCLIHNPTADGGYLVTHMKELTKKQKEFLYGYFIDMGDRFKAEQFLDGE